MSLDTYANLQVAVALHLNRAGDTTITTPLPDFITLFESRIKRRLRVREMEAQDTATMSGQTLALPVAPDAFLEMRELKINSNPVRQLEYMPPAQFWRIYASSTTGPPVAFTVSGSNLYFGPSPDSAYTVEMWFFQFDGLSASNTTNWMLTAYPDIYLFGTLVEASAFLDNDARAAMWKTRLDECMAELEMADWRGKTGAGPLRQMVEHGNP